MRVLWLLCLCVFLSTEAQQPQQQQQGQAEKVSECEGNVCTALPPPSRRVHTLLIGVTSAASYFSRRQSIRDTWFKLGAIAQQQQDLPSSSLDVPDAADGNSKHNHHNTHAGEGEEEVSEGEVSILVRFIVGKTKDQSTQEMIERENQTFGDLVQVDVDEEYSRLLAKTTALFRWADSHASFHYLLKMDDDSFVRPDLLGEELADRVRRKEDTTLVYEGRFFR